MRIFVIICTQNFGELGLGILLSSREPQTQLGGDPIGNLVNTHIIDCDTTPYIPDGWKVEEKDQLPGRVRGQIVCDPAQIKLYLSKKQQGGGYINGNKLQKELANEPVLPANVLDFLLKNPHLIPEECKKDASGNAHYIFFWGTIYRDSHGNLYVRYLCFNDGGWRWGSYWLAYGWLGSGWDIHSPAALWRK